MTFIRVNIIYCYGVLRYIISDNEKSFSNNLIDKLCEKFKFKQRKSSIYNTSANGLAEALNKILNNLLKKVVVKLKKDRRTSLELSHHISNSNANHAIIIN